MSEEKSISRPVSTASKFFKKIIPVLLTSLVGLVLLISSLPKSLEIELFMRQFGDYGIVTNPVLVMLGAWGVIITEYALGTALILNYRPRLTILPAILLFLIFIGATGWAWYTGATDDCSCFGSWVERTPGEAMVEDLFLLGALVYSWIFNRTSKAWPFRLRETFIAAALLAGVAVPLFTSTLPDRITRLIAGQEESAYETFEADSFTPFDLTEGRYLIVVMATDCSHCRALMEDIILIGSDKSLPPVVAVTMNTQEQREDFVDEFDPGFGIYQVSDDDFWRLLQEGEIPRTILADNGRILKKWDFAFPTVEEIKEVLK